MSEDKKILASVVGVVVLGMIGIAIVGALTFDPDDAGSNNREAVTSIISPIEATPASLTEMQPFFEQPVAGPTAIEFEEAAIEETAFMVQPGEDYVRRGIETYEGREFDKAAAYFQAEVEERPDRSWTQYMLGLSLWKSGELDVAVDAMTRAGELAPGSLKAFVNLSRIQNDRGEYGPALDAARSALAIDSGNPSAMFLEGRSLRNLDRPEEAIESLTRGIETDPENGFVQNLLGLTLFDLDRHADALEVLEKAVELEPEVAYIRNNLGMALEHNGRRDEAVESYRQAVALDPKHARAAGNLARLEPSVSAEETVIVEGEESPTITVAELSATEE